MTGTFTSNILYRGKVIERFEEDRIERKKEKKQKNFFFFLNFSFNLSANSERAPKVGMLCQIW